MRTKYKYVILVFITFFASIMIYKYVEASVPIPIEEDIIYTQTNTENYLLSNTNFTIDNPNVILNPYGISPLTALVIFQTKDLATVTVTVKGKDGGEDIVNTFIPSKQHILPIYGLYADYDNTVIISSSGEEKSLNIKTEKSPDTLKNADPITTEKTSKLYFTTANNGEGVPVAYDNKGNVRWFLTSNYRWDFTRLSNGHILLSNNKLMNAPYYSLGLVEMDLLGKIYYEYNLPGGYHHDVFELSNGNFLLATNDFESGTVEDQIVEIDRATGQVVKTFDLYNVMPNDDGYNWLGLNSLVYDSKTNSITVSGSNKNMILNLDYASGEINWIIADKKSVSKRYYKYLLNNNDNPDYPTNPKSVTLLKNGNIAFINNKDDSNYLTEYQIDSAQRTFSQVKSETLNSNDATNIDYTDEVLTIADGKMIKEVSDNDILTRMNTSQDIYGIKLMDVYAGDVYIAGAGQRLGNTGITPTTNSHSIIFHKADDKLIEKYKLNIYKDANRLVVSGTFKKSDKVQIILDNVLDKKTYDVKISETPYLKDDTNKKSEKIETTSYINEEGLTGKYYIYLKINDTIYKLHQFTNFW